MLDLLMISFTFLFFIVAIAYTIACDKLKWGASDESRKHFHADRQRASHGLSDLRVTASGEIL